MTLRLLALPLVAATLLAMPAAAQDPPPQAPGKPRISPPQPQQAQGPDYFTGVWAFTWVGRESPISAGPREGTLTYVRKGANSLELRAEGRIDGGAAFTETGTAEWNAGNKTMTWVERSSTGVELKSIRRLVVADWHPRRKRAGLSRRADDPRAPAVFDPVAAVLHGLPKRSR